MVVRLVVCCGAIALFSLEAAARSPYLNAAKDEYPGITGTKLDSCSLCHTSVPARNPYGLAYGSADHSFASVESLDSDGDGVSNGDEIAALTWPGKASDYPGASIPQCGCAPGAKSAQDLKSAYGQLAESFGCQPHGAVTARKEVPFRDTAGNMALFGCVFGALAIKGRRK